jgi:ABC-2 type transport system ATP-binding protein
MTATVSAISLTKVLGDRQVVSNLSFSVQPGTAFGLLGPNGSGKTTTVRMLTGLLAPTSGSVELFGEKLTPQNSDRLRSRIGVQTDTSLYETLSVRDNLRLWGDLFGLTSVHRERRIDEVLTVLGLTDRLDSLVGSLSKGMRQKVAIARAVLHEPELLFLDEPTAGLDPEATEDLIAYLRDTIVESSTTVVICTHQLHGLEVLCEEIGMIQSGRMLSSGNVRDLIAAEWPESRVEIEVSGRADHALAALPAHLETDLVRSARGNATLTLPVADEDDVPRLVRELVNSNLRIISVTPERHTIRDLYFSTIAQRETQA